MLCCLIELVEDKVEYVTVQQGMVTLSGVTKQRKRAASNLHFKRENKMNHIFSHNYLYAQDIMLAEAKACRTQFFYVQQLFVCPYTLNSLLTVRDFFHTVLWKIKVPYVQKSLGLAIKPRMPTELLKIHVNVAVQE